MVSVRELRAVGLALSVLGCSGAEMRPPAIDSRAGLREVLSAVNEQCPGLHEAQSALPRTRDDLFVEAVVLELSSESAREVSLTTLSDLPQTTRARLVAVPHVFGTYERQTEMVVGANGTAPAEPSLVRWAILPRRADRALVLEFELELEIPPQRSAPVAMTSRRTLKFAATVRDDEPALARVEWDTASRRSLLLLLGVRGSRRRRSTSNLPVQDAAARKGSASSGWRATARQSPERHALRWRCGRSSKFMGPVRNAR